MSKPESLPLRRTLQELSDKFEKVVGVFREVAVVGAIRQLAHIHPVKKKHIIFSHVLCSLVFKRLRVTLCVGPCRSRTWAGSGGTPGSWGPYKLPVLACNTGAAPAWFPQMPRCPVSARQRRRPFPPDRRPVPRPPPLLRPPGARTRPL